MITDARIFICVALVTIVANRKHVLHNRFIVYALKWHRFYICCVFFSFSFFRSCFLFVYTIFAYRLPLVMLCLNNNSNASSRKTNKQTKKTKNIIPFSSFRQLFIQPPLCKLLWLRCLLRFCGSCERLTPREMNRLCCKPCRI